jgi:hypothetical protein
MATICGTNAVAWAIGAATPNTHLPIWPAVLLGAVALAGAIVLVTALLRVWPFRYLAIAPAQALDDCIRRGRDARARITYDELDVWQVAREAATWDLYTANRLHRHYPAIADRFRLASGDEKHSSVQAAISTLDAKLAVLSEARTQLG